ncbi:Pycsar system effector family protein [Cryptosporangium sp. NPDC051539]|uniref:Pycsar system effector family protein n=1 Tax=Cryptosporangium sp. NPDC051539 TaxID=3363962 RepID=UPI0037909409
MTLPSDDGARAELIRAAEDVRAELARVDSKINTLATVAGLLLTAATALLASGRIAAGIADLLVWAGMAGLGGSLLLLLRAIRPSLRPDPAAFTALAALGETAIVAAVSPAGFATGALVRHLRLLAVLARTKYRWVRWAVDLLIAGTLTIGAAVALGVLL